MQFCNNNAAGALVNHFVGDLEEESDADEEEDEDDVVEDEEVMPGQMH